MQGACFQQKLFLLSNHIQRFINLTCQPPFLNIANQPSFLTFTCCNFAKKYFRMFFSAHWQVTLQRKSLSNRSTLLFAGSSFSLVCELLTSFVTAKWSLINYFFHDINLFTDGRDSEAYPLGSFSSGTVLSWVRHLIFPTTLSTAAGFWFESKTVVAMPKTNLSPSAKRHLGSVYKWICTAVCFLFQWFTLRGSRWEED